MNSTTVFGKVMNDPEMRYFGDGTPVTNLRVSTSRKLKDKETAAVTWENTYFTLAVKGQTAEFVNEHFKKGDYVCATFTLKPEPRVWEANDGTPRASYESQFVHNIEKAWPPKDTDPVTDEPEDEVPF